MDKTRVLIDGVFFQLAQTGISRVWKSVVPLLLSKGNVDVFMLDRGGAPLFENVTIIPFPSYNENYAADDSFLIQKICDYFKIDVFMSTLFTTPITTPSLQVIYDMIPEVFSFDLQHPFWAEKETSINYARRFICISNSTKLDLLRYYPNLLESSIKTAHLGYDSLVFHLRPEAEVCAFKSKVGVKKPYLLSVGSRQQTKGYKNGRLLFDALINNQEDYFDVVCIGGERNIDNAVLDQVSRNINIFRVDADDDDLACAYTGAAAFIYPSLYEGFGLPVVEAMACECPVITTNKASLAEIANNSACLIVDPLSVNEMSDALTKIKSNVVRAKMKSAAVLEKQKYSWSEIAEAILIFIEEIAESHKAGAYDSFYTQ